MGKILGAFDKLVDNTDPLVLKPHVLTNGIVAKGEWATPVSSYSGYSLHVLEQDMDGAMIEINSGHDDGGGYVTLDTDDLDALIDVLQGIRTRALKAQADHERKNK